MTLKAVFNLLEKLGVFANGKRELTFDEFDKVVHNGITVFVTNPKTEIKVGWRTLKVNGEDIPLKRLNGVVFTVDVERNAEEFLLKKVPTVAFTRNSFGFSNIKTAPVEGEKLKSLLEVYCHYIGEELQRFFSRYLRNSGAGITVLIRGRWRNYYVRRNRFFEPRYAKCSSENPSNLISEIGNYITDIVLSRATKALLGFLMVTSNRLGIPVPENVTLRDLLFFYAIAVYSFYYFDYIKARTYDYEEVSKIPPRGQIFVLTNEIVANQNFKSFIFDNLYFLNRFLFDL